MSKLTEFSREVAELVSRISRSLVLVGSEESWGRTGILQSDRYVLTQAVDAREGEAVSLRFMEGESSRTTVADLRGKVVAFDPSLGLAVIESDKKLPGVPINAEGPDPGGDNPFRVGELAITVAFPSSDGPEASLGVLRCGGATTRTSGGREIPGYYQTDRANR